MNEDERKVKYEEIDQNATIDKFLEDLTDKNEKLVFTEIYFSLDRELQLFGFRDDDKDEDKIEKIRKKVEIIDKYMRYFFDAMLFTLKDGAKWILTTEFENLILNEIYDKQTTDIEIPTDDNSSKYKKCFTEIINVYCLGIEDHKQNLQTMIIFENREKPITEYKIVVKFLSIILHNEIFC